MPDFGVKLAYRPQWQDTPGYKTFVNQKSEKGIFPQDTESTSLDRGQGKLDHAWPVENPQPREKERALPLPSDHDKKREINVGPTTYNKPRHVPYRTKSENGAEYGHPSKNDYNYVRRRNDVTAEVESTIAAGPFPPRHQEKQVGEGKLRSRRWYQRFKERKKREERTKYHRELKRNPAEKIERSFRRKFPLRYNRRGISPSPAERSHEWRQEQKRKANVFLEEAMTLLALDRVVGSWPSNWNTHVKKTVPPEQLDQNNETSPAKATTPRKDSERQEGGSLRAPNLDGKPQKGLKWDILPKAPGGMPSYTVNNPGSGSGKVIPMWGDFTNNTQEIPDGRQNNYLRNNAAVKTAFSLSEILTRVDAKIKMRAADLSPTLVRTDTKNWTWRWKVGDHTVRIQARSRGAAKNFSKLNLRISCSCPFWRWWGPEHWASKANYLKGDPRGTATPPKVRDPSHWRPVCKHAYAVLEKSQQFFVRPEKSKLKKLGSRFSLDRDPTIEIESLTLLTAACRSVERELARRVARRYVGGEA